MASDNHTDTNQSTLLGGAPVPEGLVPLLVLKSGTLFPSTQSTFSAGRARSLALVGACHVGDIIGVVTQKNVADDNPSRDALHDFGAYGRIVEIARVSEQHYRIGLAGLGRFRLTELNGERAHLRGETVHIADTDGDTERSQLLAEALHEALGQVKADGIAAGVVPPVGRSPGAFADQVANSLAVQAADAVQVLAHGDVPARLSFVTQLLGKLATTAKLRRDIAEQTQEHFGKHQREAILRQQLKSIQKELGDDDDSEQDALKVKLAALTLSEETQKIVDRELKRLEQAQGSEANVIRSYLELIADLPWEARTASEIDVSAIAAKLDADHAGLQDVKKRILQHMAVLKLSGNPRGTIIALAGPPGVGKTSLGQSIADAVGRPFVRIALGGVRDEAEIRGHRRTYVGALPGRIISALRKVGVKNPVVMLDELDKLGTGWGGSPEAALLEVLDPEQNQHFTDHYLETPFDLSEVMFIATANTLDPISGPLRDRLEIVEVTGYTETEKLHIATEHLLPKRARETGVPQAALTIEEGALREVIGHYTREAGVRQLDRQVTRICRQVALEIAQSPPDVEIAVTVTQADVEKYLGKVRYRSEVAERVPLSGVATGLAWTPVGGDVLFIETTQMPGKGGLEITGQLGDVMKESARAARSYVRSHAAELHIDPSQLDKVDVHLHVPAGAVPKDGPSAGVTIFTALTSLLTGRKVRSDTAMTGEVTLRGRVLPVGGIKSKVLAAHRAGVKRVILPEMNRADYSEVPESVRDQLQVIWAGDMSQVLEAALESQGEESLDLAGHRESDVFTPSDPVDEGTSMH